MKIKSGKQNVRFFLTMQSVILITISILLFFSLGNQNLFSQGDNSQFNKSYAISQKIDSRVEIKNELNRGQTLEDILRLVSIDKPMFSPSGNYLLVPIQYDNSLGKSVTQWYLYQVKTHGPNISLEPYNSVSRKLTFPIHASEHKNAQILPQALFRLDEAKFTLPIFKDAMQLRWSRLSDSIYFTSAISGIRLLYSYHLASDSFRQLTRQPMIDYQLSWDEKSAILKQNMSVSNAKYKVEYRPRPRHQLLHYNFIDHNISSIELFSGLAIWNFLLSANNLLAVEYVTPQQENRHMTDIAIYDLEKSQIIHKLEQPGAERIGAFAPPPQQNIFAFHSSQKQQSWSYHLRLFLLDINNGQEWAISGEKDGVSGGVTFSLDSQHLLFHQLQEINQQTVKISLNNFEKLDKIDQTLIGPRDAFIEHFAVHPNQPSVYIMVIANVTTAEEIYLWNHISRQKNRITDFNVQSRQVRYGRTELIHWQSDDGRPIHGLYTWPLITSSNDQSVSAKTSKHPLILALHGGPADNWTRRFSGSRYPVPVQVLSGLGYGVLRPNPRGSIGQGKEFRSANLKDWCGQDYRDAAAGVQKLIDMGLADEQKLAVAGWSYGGYLTGCTISHDNRYKAAVIGGGITNLISLAGSSDYEEFVISYMGQPQDHSPLYLERSPIMHSANISTPVLLLYGRNDSRVPFEQGLDFYRSLKRFGKTSELYIIDNMWHSAKPFHTYTFFHQRFIEWILRYNPI